jgi:adenosyl cobinamide kinase/adenosyl cobinamide phosphate guanylyltransferase
MARPQKIERKIQIQVRKVRKILLDALKDYIYNKIVDSAEFLNRLREAKNVIEELTTEVTERFPMKTPETKEN